MAYDASSRASIRAAEKAQKLAEQNSREMLVSVMATEPGRRWIHSRLFWAFTTPFTADPHMTAFNCGKQNEALALLADVVAASPEDFILMLREANERRTIAEQPGRENVDGRVDRPDGEGRTYDRSLGLFVDDYDPTAERVEAERST